MNVMDNCDIINLWHNSMKKSQRMYFIIQKEVIVVSGKLMIHFTYEDLMFGNKPIKVLIDGKEVGTIPECEKIVIDINKDCILKLKHGFKTSKPFPISNGMFIEIECRVEKNSLLSKILTNEPYNPQKDHEDFLCSMRKLIPRYKCGEISAALAFGFYKDMCEYMFEMPPAVENEVNALGRELELLYEKEEKENEQAANEAQSAVVSISEKTKEYRMRCNVCGHIFCYTDKDLTKNIENAGVEAIAAIGGLASILGGGTIFHTQHLQGQADRYADKIVDYSRCPSCRSTNISEIKDSEVLQQQNSTTAFATSPIEEIKKYKELLDMGIITQEEFDVKKKQLLGL